MAAKTKKYFSDTSKTKVKKTVTISATLSAELDRVKSEALAAGLGKLNISEFFGDKLQELIHEIDLLVDETVNETANVNSVNRT